MRLIATAVTLAVFCFGVLSAEEFRCKITKVDGSKITLNKSTKDNKVEDETLTAADNVKVVKGKWNEEAKKLEAGDAIENGLKADLFTKIDAEKGVRALVITDDSKKITEIRVMGGKKKPAEKPTEKPAP